MLYHSTRGQPENYLKEHPTDIGIIATPGDVSQSICDIREMWRAQYLELFTGASACP